MPNARPDDPADLIGDWIEAFNAHDLDRITGLYAEDAVLWGTFAAEPLDTPAGRRAYFAQAFSPALQARATAEGLHRQAEGGAAVVSGRYRLDVVRDGLPQVLPARFSAVLRRTAAGWRIAHHHSSLVPGPAVPGASSAPPALRIEPLQLAHLDELARVLGHPAVSAHIDREPPSHDELVRGLAIALAGPQGAQGSAGEVQWLHYLVRSPDGAMAGRLEATVHHGLAEVAFLLGPAFWGRGYAQAGLHWLHGEVTRRTGVVDFWATTTPANRPSQRLLQRCGYRPAALPTRPLYSHEPGDLVFHRPPAAPAHEPTPGPLAVR